MLQGLANFGDFGDGAWKELAAATVRHQGKGFFCGAATP